MAGYKKPYRFWWYKMGTYWYYDR